jgi:outer membrane protein assembly factor BamB
VRDDDGTTAWSGEIAGEPRNILAVAGRALVTHGQAIDAFALADGRRLWTATFSGVPVSAALSNRVVVVATEEPALLAVDVETGQEVWRTPLEVTPITLAASADRVYFGTSDGRICSYRTENGNRDWCPTIRVLAVGAPVLHDRFVYFAFADNTLRAFDRRSGARQETAILSARPYSGGVLSGDAVVLPLVTGEFALVRTWKRDAVLRVSAGAALESPTLRAAAIAADATLLAALNLSTAGTMLTCLSSETTETAGPAVSTSND